MPVPLPAVPVFIAGQPQTASTMTALITTPLTFCTDSILMRVQQNASQSIPATTLTVIHFDTLLEDPYSTWNATNWSFTAPFTGYYEVTLGVCTGIVNGTLASSVLISGTTQFTLNEVATPSTNPAYSCCTFIVPMVGGLDFVQGQVFASAAVSTSAAISFQSTMELKFISI
jgi:hypothetical protein